MYLHACSLRVGTGGHAHVYIEMMPMSYKSGDTISSHVLGVETTSQAQHAALTGLAVELQVHQQARSQARGSVAAYTASKPAQ